MTATPADGNGLVEDGVKGTNDLESAKFTKDKDTVDVVQPTAKLIGLTKEQLEQYRNDPFWKAVRYSLFVAFWLIWLAMFVGAILIVVLSPKCPEVKWDQKMVNYKIFTLAYSRASGSNSKSQTLDGDFSGITEKLQTLKEIGVTVIWPTPVLTIGKNTFGPEAVMNLSVHDQLGGEDAFRELVKQAHAKDMKVVVDVPLTVDASANWLSGTHTKEEKNGTGLVEHDAATVQAGLDELVKRFIGYGVDALSVTDYGLFGDNGKSAIEAIVKRIRSLPGAEQLPIFSEASLKVDENYYQVTPLIGDEIKSSDGLNGLKAGLKKSLDEVEKASEVKPEEKEANEKEAGVKKVWRLGSLDPKGHRVDELLGGKSGLDNAQKQRVSALFTSVQLFLPGPVSVLYGEELGLLSAQPKSNQTANRVLYPWTNASSPAGFIAGPSNAGNTFDYANQHDNQPNSPLRVFMAVAKLRQDPDFMLGKFAHSADGDLGFYTMQKFPPEHGGFCALVINWSNTEKELTNKNLPEAMAAKKKLAAVTVLATSSTGIAQKVDLGPEAGPVKLEAYSALVLEVPK